MVELRLGQHKFVLAAEIGQLAAEQSRPRERARMARQRIGDCLVEAAQCGLVGREIGLTLFYHRPQ